MLTWWRARSRSGRTATELYGSIVAAARRAPFYAEHNIPDTPDGRFAVIVAHTYLALERLRQEGLAGEQLARAVFEAFVSDMDDNMREMGVGDLTVPRKVRKAAGALYECAAEFRKAQPDGETALADAVQRTLLPFAPPDAARALATYMRKAAAELDVQPRADLLSGRIAYADI